MTLGLTTTGVLPLLLVLVDGNLDESDVKAGWTAFAVFILLALAVAFLGWSLTKRLRNVERAESEGRYDPSTPRRGARQADGEQAAAEQPEAEKPESERPGQPEPGHEEPDGADDPRG